MGEFEATAGDHEVLLVVIRPVHPAANLWICAVSALMVTTPLFIAFLHQALELT
jgi:hypothetical protein